jgi:hypothetical protein
MKADDFGCYYANVKLLKSALYPLRDISEVDLLNWIDECDKAGLITLYVVENKEYIKIINFGQRLRLMKSKFPQPNDGQLSDNRQSDDGLKRNETETETETETKQKRKEKKEILFCEKYQLPYEIINGEKIYGDDYRRSIGGLSKFAIEQHCSDLKIEYNEIDF